MFAQLATLALIIPAPFASGTEANLQSLQSLESPQASGLVWGDFDGDGLEDVFLLAAGRLLHNAGDATFQDVTATVLGSELAHARFAAWRDFDGNGLPDLFVLDSAGQPRLFRHEDSRSLTDVTRTCGLDALPACSHAAWVDFDRDGRPDLRLRSSAGAPMLLHNNAQQFELVDLPGTPAVPASPKTVTRVAGVRIVTRDGGRPDSESAVQSQASTSTTRTGARTSLPASPLCAPGVDDSAALGICLQASSVPELGKLYPLSQELYVDATTGYVGIGTTSPVEALEVGGTARVAGLQLTTDADAGRVLVSDADGYGTWQTFAPGNTLDEAYDQGNPGLGRHITADAGPVEITGGPTNDALQVLANGTLDALDAVNFGGGNALSATVHMGGSVLDGEILDASSTDPGIDIMHHGLGRGVHAVANGGTGVYGVSGAEPSVLPPQTAGVSGVSATQRGVVGVSDDQAGVFGKTNKIGTFASFPNVVGAVQGSSATVQDADNFAVVGNAAGYGVGVLGLGGPDEGHGVLGVAGGDGVLTKTTAAVRGVTREGPGFPSSHWTLVDQTNKRQVAVLGQADERVGVWGESRRKVGVVGNVGSSPMSFAALPQEKTGVVAFAAAASPDDVNDAGLPRFGAFAATDSSIDASAGVRAQVLHNAGETKGVHASSASDDAESAGAKTEGCGAFGPGVPRAAALEIANGALRVSGGERPAGRVSNIFLPQPILTCSALACGGCEHEHQIGWYADVLVTNNLIVGDSLIYLTCEGGDLTRFTFQANVITKGAGQAMLRISALGRYLNDVCDIPPPCSVNYLLINPFPLGQ